jgi:hypothetical protein
MFLILAAAVLGGAVTIAALWHLSAVIAFLAAPFGGSLAAGLAVVFAAMGPRRKRSVVPQRLALVHVRRVRHSRASPRRP